MKQKYTHYKRQDIMKLMPKEALDDLVQDVIIEIPDNAECLKLFQQEHPQVYKFLHKYENYAEQMRRMMG